ncbi:MAG: hypothetical protein JRG69_07535 [Deltaproteobacteria bacterium]|nr:hypothetical protein [Deltaproteobacteria bacterium]
MRSRPDTSAKTKRNSRNRFLRLWAFIVGVLTLYAILFSVSSARVVAALRMSEKIMLQIALPLLIAFIIMVVLNFSFRSGTNTGLFGPEEGN